MADSKVFIVDDHPVVRDGVTTLINCQKDLTVCGEAESASQAMRLIPEAAPDIAVVDVSLKGTDGLELIRNLKAVMPGLPVLVLSAHDEGQYAERAIRAGAMGYVMKCQEKGCLLEAIRRVLKGQIYLSPEMTPKLLATLAGNATPTEAAPEEALTDREMEVLRLTGQGLTAKEVAEALAMSPKTVQRHRDNIRAKLDLDSTTKLQFFAFRWVQGKNP